jgi:hypothetical protein
MYLQMAWLMSEGSNAPRCKGPGCPKIIRIGELEKPQKDPGLTKGARVPYRTRMDKEICSWNCKQKWCYHYIIKPQRQNGTTGLCRNKVEEPGRASSLLTLSTSIYLTAVATNLSTGVSCSVTKVP